MKLFEVSLSSKQVEFLVKCIDISQSNQGVVPDIGEIELIRKLSELNEEIQDVKFGQNLKYDLND